jgi:hypothetical protein
MAIPFAMSAIQQSVHKNCVQNILMRIKIDPRKNKNNSYKSIICAYNINEGGC